MKNTRTRSQRLRHACGQSLFTISLFISLFIFTAAPVKAQSAAVKLTAQVSGTVAISVAPDAQVAGGVRMTSSSAGQRTVAVSLTGSGNAPTEIRIPIYIRSNVGYALSASMKTGGTTLSKFLVISTQATGRFVVADALENLNIAETFDGRSGGEVQFAGVSLAALDMSSPVTLLSGSRISRAGLLSSPDNAVEVMLAVTIKPSAGAAHWSAELILSA